MIQNSVREADTLTFHFQLITIGLTHMIYLDNSATTKPCPEAVEAMAKALTAD